MDSGGLDYLVVALICLEATFGLALAGMFAWKSLPRDESGSETRMAISVAVAVVGTLAALLLGLMISTASTSFHARANDMADISSDLGRLERVLHRYGPEADAARSRLRTWTRSSLPELSPAAAQPAPAHGPGFAMLEAAQDAILALAPHDDRQAWLRTQALTLSAALMDARSHLDQHAGGRIPVAFITLLIVSLALVFGSVGLLAPPNGTVVATLFLCSLVLSGGLFIILEMDHPLSGLISISPTPVPEAFRLIPP